MSFQTKEVLSIPGLSGFFFFLSLIINIEFVKSFLPAFYWNDYMVFLPFLIIWWIKLIFWVKLFIPGINPHLMVMYDHFMCNPGFDLIIFFLITSSIFWSNTGLWLSFLKIFCQVFIIRILLASLNELKSV